MSFSQRGSGPPETPPFRPFPHQSGVRRSRQGGKPDFGGHAAPPPPSCTAREFRRTFAGPAENRPEDPSLSPHRPTGRMAKPVQVPPGIYRIGSDRPVQPGPIAAGMTEDRNGGFNRMDRMQATCSRSAPKAWAPIPLRRRDAPIRMPARSVPAGGPGNPVFGRYGAEFSVSGTKRPLTPRLR